MPGQSSCFGGTSTGEVRGMVMKVDRCVCLPMTFERLKSLADEQRLDLDSLKAKTQCCMSCKMCEPYIRRMLETGETAFLLDRKNPAPIAGKSLTIGLGTTTPPEAATAPPEPN
jgi:hypothetical protein